MQARPRPRPRTAAKRRQPPTSVPERKATLFFVAKCARRNSARQQRRPLLFRPISPLLHPVPRKLAHCLWAAHKAAWRVSARIWGAPPCLRVQPLECPGSRAPFRPFALLARTSPSLRRFSQPFTTGPPASRQPFCPAEGIWRKFGENRANQPPPLGDISPHRLSLLDAPCQLNAAPKGLFRRNWPPTASHHEPRCVMAARRSPILIPVEPTPAVLF